MRKDTSTTNVTHVTSQEPSGKTESIPRATCHPLSQPSQWRSIPPTMRSKDQDSEHIILHQLRARKATLWNKEYSVTAALIGVASNPKELAETALLELPTRNQPNQYHIYHGTQYSRAIEEGRYPPGGLYLPSYCKKPLLFHKMYRRHGMASNKPGAKSTTKDGKEPMAQLPEQRTISSESERPYKSARPDANSKTANKQRPTNARQPLRTCYERLPEDRPTTRPKNREPPTSGIAKASQADKAC